MPTAKYALHEVTTPLRTASPARRARGGSGRTQSCAGGPDTAAGEQSRQLGVDLLAALLFWRLHLQLPLDHAYLTRFADLIIHTLSDRPATASS